MTTFKFQVQDISNEIIDVTFNPNIGLNENRYPPKEATLEAIGNAVDRLDVFIAEVVSIDNKEKTLLFHKYPALSRLWCVMIVLFVYFFDP